MSATDSRGGHSRYDIAIEELQKLQAHMPGRIAVISFSSTVMFCPAGTPTNLYGGTNLAGALDFAKVADVPGMRFVVISDGIPDDERAALAVARRYKNRIDTVYVGPEGDDEGGAAFLRKLSAASGGVSVCADRAMELGATVERLMLAA